jgi:hypothetical protein
MASAAAIGYPAAMKVTTDTPDLLIIDDRPLVLAGVFVVILLVFVGIGIERLFAGAVLEGLGFAILGGGFVLGGMVVFVRRNQLVLDRPGGQVLMRRQTFVTYTERRFELADLDKAVVQTSRSSDSDTHRMALVFDRGAKVGTHPFTSVYTSGRDAQRAADAVNGWLARHGTSAAAS